jgi:hypothetical protein
MGSIDDTSGYGSGTGEGSGFSLAYGYGKGYPPGYGSNDFEGEGFGYGYTSGSGYTDGSGYGSGNIELRKEIELNIIKHISNEELPLYINVVWEFEETLVAYMNKFKKEVVCL